MTWASKVPGALSALGAAVTTAFAGDDDIAVEVGREVTDSDASKTLVIGWSSDEGSAVEATPQFGSMIVSPTSEQFTVMCRIVACDGESDMVAAWTGAYDVLATVGAALVADPKLAGAVDSARLGEHVLSTSQSRQGAVAAIAFGVDCTAFTP